MSRTESPVSRLDDEDTAKLRAALNAVRDATIALQELTLGFQRKYDLHDGDKVTRSGKIVRAPEE